MFLFIFLFVSNVAYPADGVVHNNPERWSECRTAAIKSAEGKQMEYLGGKMGVEEFLLDRCGYRPIVSGAKGRPALSDQDCATLFRWSSEGICVPEETWALDMLTRQMDPRVFDRARYLARCDAHRAPGSDNYAKFREAICESPVPN